MVRPGPLHGYRIIDVTSMISGPLATQILADQGADVLKVENPDGGDHTRAAPNRRGGLSALFLNSNRNKRSVAVNLRHERGRAVLMRLRLARRRLRAELPSGRGGTHGPR